MISVISFSWVSINPVTVETALAMFSRDGDILNGSKETSIASFTASVFVSICLETDSKAILVSDGSFTELVINAVADFVAEAVSVFVMVLTILLVVLNTSLDPDCELVNAIFVVRPETSLERVPLTEDTAEVIDPFAWFTTLFAMSAALPIFAVQIFGSDRAAKFRLLPTLPMLVGIGSFSLLRASSAKFFPRFLPLNPLRPNLPSASDACSLIQVFFVSDEISGTFFLMFSNAFSIALGATAPTVCNASRLKPYAPTLPLSEIVECDPPPTSCAMDPINFLISASDRTLLSLVLSRIPDKSWSRRISNIR